MVRAGAIQTGGSQGSNGGQPGNSAGGGSGGGTGSFGGQSTGPVGGSGGAISQVANPIGQGIARSQTVASQPEAGTRRCTCPRLMRLLRVSGTGARAPVRAHQTRQYPAAIQGAAALRLMELRSPGELGGGTLNRKSALHINR